MVLFYTWSYDYREISKGTALTSLVGAVLRRYAPFAVPQISPSGLFVSLNELMKEEACAYAAFGKLTSFFSLKK